jgi:L-ribulose-5-phosphate 4-epimerase
MGRAMLENLKKEAFEINMAIVQHKLVVLTWGNASALDRSSGIMAIKPSGVAYDTLTWQDMVLVDLEGKVIDSKLKPSSDTLTHLEIYKGFPDVGGIVHTHSPWATTWAQAGKPIPALGTTHADHFSGDVPCLPPLTKVQVEEGYEKATGSTLVNYFLQNQIHPLHIPACLLSGHASFVWGKTIAKALENAVALESCAQMAYHTLMLNPLVNFPDYILNKHFTRKHGKDAYYGQKG